MKKFRDFEGKNIDAAIEAACRFFDKDRDELEIEILSGGSSGIFGLVGVKQARVRAQVRGAVAPQQPRKEAAPKRAPRKKAPSPAEKPAPKSVEAPAEKPVRKQTEKPARKPVEKRVEKPVLRTEEAIAPIMPRGTTLPQPVEATPGVVMPVEMPVSETAAQRGQEREEVSSSKPQGSEPRMVAVRPEDGPAVEEAIRSTVTTLLEAIVGRAELSIDMTTDPIGVVIHDEENSGLIIGRDGQTITALQYLTNRIVSQQWPDVPRVQLDAGEYREKQEDQLKKTAEFLADKARKSGRVQSTRPLSSYHRRVVHITLQDDRTVQTRSKGDGPMKRVLIIPKRNGGGRPKGKRPYQPVAEGE